MTSASPSSSSTLAAVRSAMTPRARIDELMRAIRRAGGRGLGQRLRGIRFFEQPLPVQIAGLDVVAVDQGQPAHSGPRQRRRVETAQRAAPGDHRVRAQQAPPARARRFPGTGSAANSARDREGSMHCDGNKQPVVDETLHTMVA